MKGKEIYTSFIVYGYDVDQIIRSGRTNNTVNFNYEHQS